MNARILLVEDDPDIAEVVTHHLSRASFDVQSAPTAKEAWETYLRWRPDLVVLDLMLPDGHGFDLCRRLRGEGDRVGILMLTALSDEADQVAGLELGADDYVEKPFRPRELVARVRALWRRVRQPSGGEAIRVGPLALDPVRMATLVHGQAVSLTAMEFALLAALARTPGAVLSRRQLLDLVWGGEFVGDERTVDVHVRHIRNKLAPLGADAMLETVRGVGYRLRDDGA